MPLKPQHVLAELKAPDLFEAGILSQFVTRHVRGGDHDHCSRPPLNIKLESSFESSLKTSLEMSFETSVLIRVVSGAHNVSKGDLPASITYSSTSSAHQSMEKP